MRKLIQKLIKLLEQFDEKFPVVGSKKVEKMPHDVFPNLVYWNKGDRINVKNKEKDSYSSYIGEYIGILNEEIYIGIDNEIRQYSAEKAKKLLHNNIAVALEAVNKKKELLLQMEDDSYCTFLKELRALNQRFLEPKRVEDEDRNKIAANKLYETFVYNRQ